MLGSDSKGQYSTFFSFLRMFASQPEPEGELGYEGYDYVVRNFCGSTSLVISQGKTYLEKDFDSSAVLGLVGDYRDSIIEPKQWVTNVLNTLESQSMVKS